MQRGATGADWVGTLAKKHGARERAAVDAASAASDRAAETTTLSLDRWTHIVAAMRQLMSAYNDGFGRDVLRLTEDRSDPNRPAVTIAAGSDGSPSLVAALEGTLICVRSRDREGLLCDAERPLLPDRGDDRTAAYVLQHWMENL